MKKVIYSLTLSSLLVASPVFAQDGIRGKFNDVREEVKERVELRRASTTEKRAEKVSKISKRMVEQAGKVMQATIDRLEKIASRIESRIAKVKAEGGDTTESERYLAEGKTHISEAKTALRAFLAIDLSTGTTTMNTNVSRIREAAKIVKTHLREAHASLVKAINNLKSGRSNRSQ